MTAIRSQLARQLELVSRKRSKASSSSTHTHNNKNVCVSFLFDAKHASTLDVASVYDIAISSYNELERLDTRFTAFRDTLFSSSSVHTQREMQTHTHNQTLDEELIKFLRLLSPYLLLTPAHNAMEFLVRHYSVHVTCTHALLASAMPFHHTKLFARVLQLTPVRDDKLFNFLTSSQRHLAPVPRAVFVQRCADDVALLEYVCVLGEHAAETSSHAAAAAVSFVVATLVELIALTHVDAEKTFRVLLQFVCRASQQQRSSELHVGAHLVFVQLCVQRCLRADIAEQTLCTMMRVNASELQQQRVVLVTLSVMHAMMLNEMSQTLLRMLLRISSLLTMLRDVTDTAAKRYFITLLLRALLVNVFSDDTHAACIERIVCELRISNDDVSMLAHTLFSAPKNPSSRVITILRSLDAQHPSALQCVLRSMFYEHSTSKRLLRLLARVFSGTKHALLPESGISVYISLEHHLASVRSAAMNAFDVFCCVSSDSVGRECAVDVFERRLHDDNEDVQCAVMRCKNLLVYVDAAHVVHRARMMMSSTHSASIESALIALISVATQCAHLVDAVVTVLLPHVLVHDAATASCVAACENVTHTLLRNVNATCTDVVSVTATNAANALVAASSHNAFVCVTAITDVLWKTSVSQTWHKALYNALSSHHHGDTVIVALTQHYLSSSSASSSVSSSSSSSPSTPSAAPSSSSSPSSSAAPSSSSSHNINDALWCYIISVLPSSTPSSIFECVLLHTHSSTVITAMLCHTSLQQSRFSFLLSTHSPSLSSMLHLVRSLVASKPDTSFITLTPALLPALTHTSSDVRVAALTVISALSSAHNNASLYVSEKRFIEHHFLSSLLSYISSIHSEILSSSTAIATLIPSKLSHTSQQHFAHLLLQSLLHTPTNTHHHHHINALISLSSALPLATHLSLLSNVLTRFPEPDLITHLHVSADSSAFLYRLIINDNNEYSHTHTMQQAALSSFTNQRFSLLNKPLQRQFLQQLCTVWRNDTVTELLASLTLSGVELSVILRELDDTALVFLLDALHEPHNIIEPRIVLATILDMLHVSSSTDTIDTLLQAVIALASVVTDISVIHHHSINLSALIALIASSSTSHRCRALQALSAVSTISPSLFIQQYDAMLSSLTNALSSSSSYFDAYSLSVLQQSIDVFVSLLNDDQTRLMALLNVFVSAFDTIPVQYRYTLFASLLHSLGASFINTFFVKMMQRHDDDDDDDDGAHDDDDNDDDKARDVVDDDEARNADDDDGARDDALFVHRIFGTFTVEQQLNALRLIVIALPSSASSSICAISNTAVEFVHARIAQQSFGVQIRADDENDEDDDDDDDDSNITNALHRMYIAAFDVMESEHVLHDALNQIVQRLCALMNLTAFVHAQLQLLSREQTTTTRNRALHIIVDRLAHHQREACVAQLLPPLQSIITSSSDTSLELALNAVVAVATLSTVDVVRDNGVLVSVVRIAHTHTHEDRVIVCALHSAAILCTQLAVHALPHLATLVATSLQHATAASSSSLLVGALSALQLIAQTLRQFMSVHIVSILKALLVPQLLTLCTTNNELDTLLISIMNIISISSRAKLLVQSVAKVYKRIAHTSIDGAKRILRMLRNVVDELNSTQAKSLHKTLFKFILIVFDGESCADFSVQHEVVCVFRALVLKLNELQLQPLIFKLVEWTGTAVADDEDGEDGLVLWRRHVILFRIYVALIDALRTIFVPYIKYVFDNLIVFISFTATSSSAHTLRLELVSLALDVLQQCCALDDEHKFIGKVRFETLLAPLLVQVKACVAQRSFEEHSVFLESHLLPTFISFAESCGEEVYWKPLLHGVLMHSRDTNALVRVGALRIVHDIFFKIREPLLALLPETIPFVAEAMEDHDEQCEKLVQQLIEVIEDVSGESLQDYLNK